MYRRSVSTIVVLFVTLLLRSALLAQGLSADLIGSNFPISQWPNEQAWPSIAYNSSASEYLVAWWDYRDTPDADAYGQRVSSTGTLQGSNFQISPDARKQLYTAVAYNSTDTEYLVVWEEHINESTEFDIYGQRVSSTGNLLSNPILIVTAPDIQAQPVVAYGSGCNGYLVVWHDNRKRKDPPDWDIYAQRVSRSGDLVGDVIPISTLPSHEANPDVVYNATANEYFVAWRDERSQTGGGWDIFGQRLSCSGTLVGDEIPISTVAQGQRMPAVAWNSTDNEYLVVWQDNRNGSDWNIWGQRISWDGILRGVNFPIRVASGVHEHADVAYGVRGNEYLVVWASFETMAGYDIIGRRVSATGDLLGSEIPICTASGNQKSPAVAYSSNTDDYLVVWQDTRGGAGEDIYGQRVAAAAASISLVLFGGMDQTDTLSDDTWKYNGSDWLQVTPPGSVPSARYAHGMVSDVNRGRLVLFGGVGAGQYLTDTWEYADDAWTQVTPADAPGGRISLVMAYDSDRGITVLFGGRASNGDFLDDTWEYDGTTWRNISTQNSPPGSAGAAMVYDQARQRMVLLTGWQGNGFGWNNETWEYDGTDWTRVTSGPLGGVWRYHHQLAYDPVRQRVVLFGGFHHGGAGCSLDDTWEYDGQQWTEVVTDQRPPGRCQHMMAYYEGDRAIILFGGISNSTKLGDTWKYDGTDWQQVVTDHQPPARYRAGLAQYSSEPSPPPNPVPTITSLSPDSATAGGPAFTLTVHGTNFVNSSVVRWNGSDRTTTFVSSTELQAEITAADIATPGTASVTVFNPPPGGGTSNALTFTISGPDTPDIRVTPIAVEVTLPEGESTTVPLTIANVGDATLTFSIAKEQGSTGAGGRGGKGKREKGKKGAEGQRSRGARERGGRQGRSCSARCPRCGARWTGHLLRLPGGAG